MSTVGSRLSGRKPWSRSYSLCKSFGSRSETHAELSRICQGEEMIVTPFAQIIAGLQNVRNNFLAITNLAALSTAQLASFSGGMGGPNPLLFGSSATAASPEVIAHTAAPGSVPRTNALSPEEMTNLSLRTLEELNWCIGELEMYRGHRSVSDMASTKFKRMVKAELRQRGEGRGSSEVSEFILKNFTSQDREDEVEMKQSPDEATASGAATGSSRKPSTACQPLSSSKGSTGPIVASGDARIDALPPFGIDLGNCLALAKSFEQINSWGLDIFEVDRLSRRQPLITTLYTILKERTIITDLNLDPRILVNYLIALERKYRQSNAYHNSIHAADVAQTVHVMLAWPVLGVCQIVCSDVLNAFTNFEVLAAIFAAAIHDVDHPGLTNNYLVNTGNPLAITYNDEAVLEQHHIAVAYRLFQDQPNSDFLAAFSRKQRQTFRKLVIDMVMATDMTKHMNLLAELKSMVENNRVTQGQPNPDCLPLETSAERIRVLQNIVHFCDLSNPTKPLNLYEQWVGRIMSEYWNQGDLERSAGIEISALCDRHNASIPKSQLGFIDFVVHPLAETWSQLISPYFQVALDNLELNREHYSRQLPESPVETEQEEDATYH